MSWYIIRPDGKEEKLDIKYPPKTKFEKFEDSLIKLAALIDFALDKFVEFLYNL